MTITDLGQATGSTKPMVATPAPSNLHPGQNLNEPHTGPAGVDSDFDSGQVKNETHETTAAVESTNPAGHPGHEAQRPPAGGEHDQGSGQQATPRTDPNTGTLADPLLALAADARDDLQRTRVANENRLRQLTRSETDVDGEERGFGLDETHPDVARAAVLVDMLRKAEHQATLDLNRHMRYHPLGPWCKAQKGIGNGTFPARLLAIIGDPYINMQTGEIRTVSQLWAYCGHGDPNRKLKKGMSQKELFALGNKEAKSIVWNIATACLKAQGDYADVYYDRKAKTEGKLHTTECVRCGPSGKPAQPGSPWSDAHRHADALRITGKQILKDLWVEAKRLHETTDSGQRQNASQLEAAAVGNDQGRQS